MAWSAGGESQWLRSPRALPESNWKAEGSLSKVVTGLSLQCPYGFPYTKAGRLETQRLIAPLSSLQVAANY